VGVEGVVGGLVNAILVVLGGGVIKGRLGRSRKFLWGLC